ncbi:hypothetical protein OAS39_13770, partial [Pirellulales bacterium]|nr:hypothetical protein [Pirellulales bacterium]
MRRIPAASRNRRPLRCELLESRILLDGHGIVDLPLESGLIYGRVWEDANANRHVDAGEGGMGGVTVYSDLNFNGHLGPDEPSAVTIFDNPNTDFDEGGFYILDQLQPGFHNVREIVPDGFEQTWPSLPPGFLPPPWGDPSVHVVFVGSGEAVDDVDFGNRPLANGFVEGRKWLDANGNGIRESDEPGLEGVTIYADLNQNGVLDSNEPSTITAADIPETDFDEGGFYHLELPAGEHWIAEVIPHGFVQTFPNHPVPAIFPPPPGGRVHEVLLAPGEVLSGIDFGNRPVENGFVSGRTWVDMNANAEHDPDETGMGGVTIYADYNFNS